MHSFVILTRVADGQTVVWRAGVASVVRTVCWEVRNGFSWSAVEMRFRRTSPGQRSEVTENGRKNGDTHTRWTLVSDKGWRDDTRYRDYHHHHRYSRNRVCCRGPTMSARVLDVRALDSIDSARTIDTDSKRSSSIPIEYELTITHTNIRWSVSRWTMRPSGLIFYSL